MTFSIYWIIPYNVCVSVGIGNEEAKEKYRAFWSSQNTTFMTCHLLQKPVMTFCWSEDSMCKVRIREWGWFIIKPFPTAFMERLHYYSLYLYRPRRPGLVDFPFHGPHMPSLALPFQSWLSPCLVWPLYFRIY